MSLTLSKTWQQGPTIYFSGVSKNAEFYADFNSIKKLEEKIIFSYTHWMRNYNACLITSCWNLEAKCSQTQSEKGKYFNFTLQPSNG